MKLTYVLLVFIIVVVLIIPSVMADPYFYESSIPHTICAGSRTNFQFYLKNNDNAPNRFNITVNSNQSYFNWIPHSINLIPGSSVPVYVFANTNESSYGNYSFKISARYGLKTISNLINYEVIDCNRYQISLLSDNFCANTKIMLSLAITNLGIFDNQKIKLFTSSGKVSPNSVILSQNQSAHFNISLNPISQLGIKTITLKAYLPNKNITIYKNISFKINSCASYNASISAKNNKTCTGEKLSYEIKIANTGTSENTYNLSSSQGTLSVDSINLSAGSSKTVRLELISETPGTFPVIVKIKPKTGKEKDLIATYSAEDCCNASLYATDVPISVCSNEPIETAIPITLKNFWAPESFKISSSSSWAVAQKTSASLSRNSSETFIVRLGPISLPGIYHAKITASSRSCRADAYVTMNVKNCYKFSVSQSLLASPKINNICSCTSRPFKINVKNTGSVNDTYTLSLLRGNPELFNFANQKIDVASGKQGSFSGTINVPCSYKSTGSLEFVVSSRNNPQLTRTVNVVIGAKQCYGVSVVMNNVNVCPNQKFNISAIFLNTGNMTDNYSMNLNCPSWISTKGYKHNITIAAGNRNVMTFSGMANSSEASNSYLCAVEIKSMTDPSITSIASSKISIGSVEKCFCYQPQLNQTKITMVAGSSKVISLAINNCGTQKQKYAFRIIGNHSDWIIIEPSKLTIIPNGYDLSYLALLPKSNAEPGTYNFTLEINPEKTGYLKRLPFTINIKNRSDIS